jgi:hypothetical protein
MNTFSLFSQDSESRTSHEDNLDFLLDNRLGFKSRLTRYLEFLINTTFLIYRCRGKQEMGLNIFNARNSHDPKWASCHDDDANRRTKAREVSATSRQPESMTNE